MSLSYAWIDPDAVVIRRCPRRERCVPRGEVDRFDVQQTEGEGVRLRGPQGPLDYLALLLKDGTSVGVPCGRDPQLAALRLNNELGGV